MANLDSELELSTESLILLASAAARHRELGALAASVLDTLMAVLPLAGASLHLVEEAERVLRPVAERLLLEGRGVRRSPPVSLDSPDFLARPVMTKQPQLEEHAVPGRTRAVFPLVVAGRVEGVLEVFHRGPGAFSRSAHALLEGAADVIAVAVAGARKENAARQLEAMRKASLAISGALAVLPLAHLRAALARGLQIWPQVVVPEFLRSVLQSIVDYARQVAGAEYAALGIGDSTERSFEPWVYSGMSPELAARIGRYPRPVATLGVVAREGRAIRMPDMHRHPAFAGFPPHHPMMTSILAVPLEYQGVSLGNLYLTNKIGADEFSAEDQRAVELFAAQAAMALQQTYLRMSIEAQHTQMQGILESAPHGIIFVDAKTGHVMANPRAMELLGLPIVPRDGCGQYVSRLRYPDGRPLAVNDLLSSRILRGEDVSQQELLIVRPDGTQIPVLESAAPVRGLDNEVSGVVKVFEDISIVQELQHLREEFAAMVAHDLRSPLQAILLQVELLLRGARDGQVVATVERVRRIQQSVSYLATLARDLLDVTRLELHRLPLERVPRALPELAIEVVERLRPTMGGHSVEVRVEASPPVVLVDVLRFQQILTNLLENAAKYSGDEAPIRVRLSPAEDGAELVVEDEGVGIEPEDIPRLFDRFFQSRRAREKRTGLGLGLYITKGLVEAHGGRISVESAPGRGAAFRVWLPCGERAFAGHTAPPPG